MRISEIRMLQKKSQRLQERIRAVERADAHDPEILQLLGAKVAVDKRLYALRLAQIRN